ncbi:MAG: 1-acyl-sn-glycerol-3-phosphate acyltransferase, partial [Cellvibrionaceae bacterium]
MKNAIVSRIYFWGLWLCTKVFTRVTITGWENVPAPADGGLLIVSNHFTVFEIPFIGTYLPKAPGFFATRELL